MLLLHFKLLVKYCTAVSTIILTQTPHHPTASLVRYFIVPLLKGQPNDDSRCRVETHSSPCFLPGKRTLMPSTFHTHTHVLSSVHVNVRGANGVCVKMHFCSLQEKMHYSILTTTLGHTGFLPHGDAYSMMLCERKCVQILTGNCDKDGWEH